jgi:MoaA/NifB/PqqE/SkfB family radical SAM enzyme
MHVSIEGDGHIAAYDEIESNFETVKKNVELLHKMRPDVRIIINHLLFKTNLEKAREIIYFCKTVNAGITFFFPMFFSKELDEKYNAHKVPDLIEKLVELAKLCVENGVPYSMTNPCVERPCMRALSQPIIAYDGTVYPCDYVYQNIENTKDGSWINWYNGEQHIVPQNQYAMGNIYKDDFIKMWNSEKWKKLRSIVTELNEKGSGKSFYETLKDINLDKEFDHCKVCLARWGRCL